MSGYTLNTHWTTTIFDHRTAFILACQMLHRHKRNTMQCIVKVKNNTIILHLYCALQSQVSFLIKGKTNTQKTLKSVVDFGFRETGRPYLISCGSVLDW